MSEECGSLMDLVAQDPRYPIEAYFFVRESLTYAADAMELGICPDPEEEGLTSEQALEQSRRERHLTGQQLCEAIREFAINQFGYMAKVVLKSWNVTQTQCFGDIVYNMIRAGIMKKSSNDRREHFDDVFCFDEAFEQEFEICSVAQRRL